MHTELRHTAPCPIYRRPQDISDEMRQVINALRGHDDKIRVVLNKADQVRARVRARAPARDCVWLWWWGGGEVGVCAYLCCACPRAQPLIV